MSDKQNHSETPVIDPVGTLAGQGIRGETLGCPTGLGEALPAPPDISPEPSSVNATAVHGPLQVEKLEGRQETGRDAQDESEEDETQD